MKKFSLLIFVLFLSIAGYAQLEVKPGSFKEVPGFVNINTDIYDDENGVLFAVIKVNTLNINDKQRRELFFKGNEATSVELEYKVGEVWVYVSSKPATYLKISHPQLGFTEFWFPFDLQPKKGYEMVLVNNSSSEPAAFGALTVTSKPENDATILFNGTYLNYKTPYTNDMIAVGEYEITVSKERYKPITKTVTVAANEKQNVEFDLPIDVATITINTDDTTAIYIDDKYMGFGKWSGELYSGEHKIFLNKSIYQQAEKIIQVKGGENQTINIELPTLPCAVITLIADDRTKTFIDDQELWSPGTHKTKLTTGKHKITYQKRACRPDSTVITVVAGQNATYELHPTPYEHGNLRITSEPSGATVFVDYVEVGVTPLEFHDLSVGWVHHYKIVKEGYMETTGDFLLENDNMYEINETLAYYPADMITKAVFTVNADSKKVYFAKGNLQYQASTDTWRFAEHQWDYIGEGNKDITSTNSGWTDLFKWGVSGKAIENGGNKEGVWSILYYREWEYVFDKRETTSGIRYAMATVNEVAGVILLPDSWNKDTYKLQKANDAKAHYSDNIITSSDWNTYFDANGAVFLPAAGSKSGTTLLDVGVAGEYWCSTNYPGESNSYFIYFTDGDMRTEFWGKNSGCRSVRLVFIHKE